MLFRSVIVNLILKLVVAPRRLKLVPHPLRTPRLRPPSRHSLVLLRSVNTFLRRLDPLSRIVLLLTDVLSLGLLVLVPLEKARVLLVALGRLVPGE